MAHTKSTIKRIRQNEKRKIKNRATRSKVKTHFKKIQYAIKNNEKDSINTLYQNYVSALDKACKVGVYHKNYASRKKSNLMKQINILNKQEVGGQKVD